jgi:hypothetical protein
MHFDAHCIPSLYLQGTALAAASFRNDFVILSLTAQAQWGLLSSADTLLQVDIRLLCD